MGKEAVLHDNDDVWPRTMSAHSFAAIADVITEEGSPIAAFTEEDNRSFQLPPVPDAEGSLARVPVVPVARVPVEDIENVPRGQIAVQIPAEDHRASQRDSSKYQSQTTKGPMRTKCCSNCC